MVSGFTPETGILQYYKGTIGNVTQIQMSLQLEGIQMNGSFINEETGEVFVLTGFIGEATQSVVLKVNNDKDVHIAQIQAHYYTNDLEEIVAIKGGYIELKTKHRKLLNLEKIAEYTAKIENNRGERKF